MASITTTTAINHHMDLWIRSDSILNSSPLLFFTLSLLFLPLTLTTTTTFLHDDVITPTPYDVIKTLTTFTAATSLIILRTTHSRLTLTSAVKSFPPLFTTLITETALLLFSALAIAFSPFAVTELLGLGFDVKLVKLGVVLVVVVSVVYLLVIWGFSAPVAVLEGRYGFAALRESERRMVRFRGRSFLMVVFGVFRFGPLLFWMSVVAKGSTYWVLVVNRCAVYLLFSFVITQYVVMYTILYVQCRLACREYEVSGYAHGIYKDDDKVGGQGFTLLFHFVLFVWVGTTMASLI